MSCDCVAGVNALLREEECELVLSLDLGGRRPAAAVIETQKISGASRRARKRTLIATFCPFCGVKYPEAS